MIVRHRRGVTGEREAHRGDRRCEGQCPPHVICCSCPFQSRPPARPRADLHYGLMTTGSTSRRVASGRSPGKTGVRWSSTSIGGRRGRVVRHRPRGTTCARCARGAPTRSSKARTTRGHVGSVPLSRVRSDSDMHTLGFNFKPGRGEVDRRRAVDHGLPARDVEEHDIARHIRFGTRSPTPSVERRFALDDHATVSHRRQTVTLTANYLFMCSGTTATAAGTRPSSRTRVVHGTGGSPQAWPTDLDYAGKRRARDRVGRDGDDVGAGDSAHGRPRHDAPALAHIRVPRPTRTRGQPVRKVLPTRWPTGSRGARTRRSSSSSISARARNRQR